MGGGLLLWIVAAVVQIYVNQYLNFQKKLDVLQLSINGPKHSPPPHDATRPRPNVVRAVPV